VAHGDRKIGEGLSDHPFMLRLEEGEEEADCDGLRVPRAHLVGDATGLALRERTEDAASRVDALAGAETHLPDDGWRWPRDPEIVEIRPVLAADDQQILEARGGHKDRPRSSPLKDRVRGHGRPVSHADGPEILHPLDHCARRVSRRRDFRGHDLAAAEPHEVRERPAHIHADIHRGPDCPRPQETSRNPGRQPTRSPPIRAAVVLAFSDRCFPMSPRDIARTLRCPAGRGHCS